MDELPPLPNTTPPDWSLFMGSFGRIAVLASVALFAIAAIAWLLAAKNPRLERLGRWSFVGGCAGLFATFATLATLFVTNRFEFSYVWGHADKANAIPYRIAGIWSGQQGSFLLWAVCSALMGLFALRHLGAYRRWYTVVYSLFLGTLAAILAYETPFGLNMVDGKPFVPNDGVGLAPSLQNYWVVIHPPTIFFGFGSLTVLFAMAVAALAMRDYERWIPVVRPWAILSTTILGLGLCMGGFWAYETLGWGGFWMWDPVENVSFVPWCFGVALIHGVIVQASRGKWQITNLLLAGAPFLIFVYGTFLTRSGFLSDASVHSFAEMDRSALKLLIGLMGVATLGFAGLWGFRAFQNRGAASDAPEERGWGREAFYLIGIATLLMLGIATAIGMSVPLVQALRGQQARVVEEGLYHQVLAYIFIPCMLVMAVTPFVAWRGMKARELFGRLYTVLCVTVGLMGIMLSAVMFTPARGLLELQPEVTLFGSHKVNGMAWILILAGLCVFATVANVWRMAELAKFAKLGVMSYVSHIGIAVLMAGLILSRGFEQTGRAVLLPDHPTSVLNYMVSYEGMTSTIGDRNNKLLLRMRDLRRKDDKGFVARPGAYEVVSGNGQTSFMVWPHIQRAPLMDVYVAVGQPQMQSSNEFTLKPGESARFGDLALTYQEMDRTGDFGQLGTTFGARVKVVNGDETRIIRPHMEIGGESGTIPHSDAITEDLNLVMIAMDAANKSVTFRIDTSQFSFPIEVYHKPMTIFVWLGTGIVTIAGLLAAFYRRMPRPKEGSEPSAPMSDISDHEPELVGASAGEPK